MEDGSRMFLGEKDCVYSEKAVKKDYSLKNSIFPFGCCFGEMWRSLRGKVPV